MGTMAKVLKVLAGVAALAPFGCRERRTVVVHREAPPQRVVVVERQPETVLVEPGPGERVVYVREAPPRPRVEVILVRPGPRYVWVDGYWAYRRNNYVWAPGRWVLPPRHGAVWVGHTWHRAKGGWYVTGGHWR